MKTGQSSEIQAYTTRDTDSFPERYLNPADINIETGYRIEVFAYGLNTPVNMLFTDNGTLLVAESGLESGNPRILSYVNNNFEVVAEDFRSPITGMNYLDGILYVSHRGYIIRITQDGVKQTLITGLPSNGDYYNGRVVFSPDRRRLYFGQGTATNSAVVGQDNNWKENHPLLCDYPGDYIILNGQNFETRNIDNEVSPNEIIYTGAFSPYGNPNAPFEIRKEFRKASGSILSAQLDGTNIQLFAWGFRFPLNIKFDSGGQLYAANIGYDNRGSRPIANAPDEFFAVTEENWYGWPDYSGGEPVSLPRFTPEGGVTPELLIKNIPNTPPVPFTTFQSNSNIMGFDFDYNNFGTYGDVYIAEYGNMGSQTSRDYISYAGIGHRISRIDMKTRTVTTFAINRSGFPTSISREGGFGRPVDIVFGPDGAMYVLDAGIESIETPGVLMQYTGVIWRITRTAT